MGSVYAIAGFLALIVFVVIPIHELGHMLVARRLRVQGHRVLHRLRAEALVEEDATRSNTASRRSPPAAT